MVAWASRRVESHKGGWALRALSLVVFVYYLVPDCIYAFWFDISVILHVVAMYDARGYLVWTLLGIISIFDHYIQSSGRLRTL